MRFESNTYVVLSREENNPAYWDDEVYPDWATLKLFRYFPDQRIGCGVEPHYHDCDEIWMFIDGRGEAWLDGQSHAVEPGTFVFTPRGVVHRFQMFSDFRNCALRTELVGKRRPIHIIPEEHGAPEKSGDALVVPVAAGTGRIQDASDRFPLAELRVSRGEARVDRSTVEATEYWLAIDGRLTLEVNGTRLSLGTGDLAILRRGAERSVLGDAAAHGYARERA